jgi:ABC-2 type transport system ATP-binding protein
MPAGAPAASVSPVPDSPALVVDSVSHRYGDREALRGVSFEVPPAQIFGLLGPNGGGKTTLFRILATLMLPTSGTVRVCGDDVRQRPAAVRRHIGVVFQSPALDDRLSVRENLVHHGHLYGLAGRRLHARIAAALDALSIVDRGADLVAGLSGGLKRRVEIAKALLPEPRVLLLDEPSTGLDPGARLELWEAVDTLRTRTGATVAMTTHLMDEAARCDRVGILHQGRLVAIGTPAELTGTIGGDVLWITPAGAVADLRRDIAGRFEVHADVVDGRVRLELPHGHEFVTDVIEAFPGRIQAVTFSRPTLEDVFVHHTGTLFV